MRYDIEQAPAQQKLLAAILDILDRGEQIPNYQILASRLGISKSRIPETIRNLKDKGYIRCEQTSSGNVRTGSIEPTGKAWEWRSRSGVANSAPASTTVLELTTTQPVAVRGRVGAGGGQYEDGQGDSEHLPLPVDRVRGTDVYTAEVRGDSMAGDDLRTGDHVIIDPHAPWSDGDMVVVVNEGAMQVKRLWHQDESIVLESSNPEHKPIILKKGREHLGGQGIQGKVIGVVLWHVKPGRRNNPMEARQSPN
jgi:SOS-response transcriptional repressor LexA